MKRVALWAAIEIVLLLVAACGGRLVREYTDASVDAPSEGAAPEADAPSAPEGIDASVTTGNAGCNGPGCSGGGMGGAPGPGSGGQGLK